MGIKNLTGTAIDRSDIRYIADEDWGKWTKRVTPRHLDIVFSYEATLGRFALIPADLECCLGRRLALVRTREVDGYPHYVFHWFVSAPFQSWLTQHTMHGATVDRIPLVHFPSYPIVIPNDDLMRIFEAQCAPVWQKIHKAQAEIETLSNLRDSLLPGQLSIPEAEQQLTKVL